MYFSIPDKFITTVQQVNFSQFEIENITDDLLSRATQWTQECADFFTGNYAIFKKQVVLDPEVISGLQYPEWTYFGSTNLVFKPTNLSPYSLIVSSEPDGISGCLQLSKNGACVDENNKLLAKGEMNIYSFGGSLIYNYRLGTITGPLIHPDAYHNFLLNVPDFPNTPVYIALNNEKPNVERNYIEHQMGISTTYRTSIPKGL